MVYEMTNTDIAVYVMLRSMASVFGLFNVQTISLQCFLPFQLVITKPVSVQTVLILMRRLVCHSVFSFFFFFKTETPIYSNGHVQILRQKIPLQNFTDNRFNRPNNSHTILSMCRITDT